MALGVMGVAMAFFGLQSPEPAYQGRRLSEWLTDLTPGGYPVGDKELTRVKELVLQLGSDAPDSLVTFTETIGQTPEKERRAMDAIRQIGTNGIPALLRMLQYKQSPLKRTLARLISKQSLVKYYLPPARVPPMRAVSGLRALGPAAKPAIPELVALLHNGRDGMVAYYAGLALAGIGPEVIPLLTSALPNEDVAARSSAVCGLWLAGPRLGPLASESHRVVPALVSSLKDSNAGIRENAVIGLGQFLTEPEIVVPALIESLQWDPNPSVRARAPEALSQFRSRAKPAIPALLAALKDRAGDVRDAAGEALKIIDPDAATKAGVK